MNAVAAIDIGNTRAKFGLISDPALGPVGEVTATVLEDGQSLPDQLLAWWHSTAAGRACSCVIAGSDPDCRDQLLQNWPVALPQPLVIRSGSQIPVHADVDYPSRVGIDRLLNAYAAQFLLTTDQAAIIVDSGTATTVDLVTPGPVFRGGSILPGLRLAARALHDYTARLPLVDVDESLTQLPVLPGRNTEDAIMAGLFLGQLGAVREIVAGLQNALHVIAPQCGSPRLIISGGGGRQLTSHLPNAFFADSLALHGLAWLAHQQGAAHRHVCRISAH
ncbi:MAG: Type pantothenate kinase [Planctomycetota bacterium]|jgi:type III pantothenate kinase